MHTGQWVLAETYPGSGSHYKVKLHSRIQGEPNWLAYSADGYPVVVPEEA